MIDFLKGIITEVTPTFCIVDVNNVGYELSISLNTYTEINTRKDIILYVHESIREDAYQLFGFSQKLERTLFRKLITVSGIGPSVARVMLSSMNPSELSNAIISGDVNSLKAIKGIGSKTAERVILDLKDKLKLDESIEYASVATSSRIVNSEAVAALVMLGYNQKSSEKVVQQITKQQPELTIDKIIKQALKLL